MKRNQIRLLLPALALIIVFLASCSSEPNDKFIGTWIAEDVQADVDTTRLGPEQLSKVIEDYRSFNFQFLANDSMNLIARGNPYPGTWEFRDDEQAIYIEMGGTSAPEPLKFADYEDGKLINTNETQLGTIVVTYIKQKD